MLFASHPLAAAGQSPGWLRYALVACIVFSLLSIVISLFSMVWVAGLQLRRFSRAFDGRPDAAQALDKVLSVYGWRARLASKLFRIPIPPG